MPGGDHSADLLDGLSERPLAAPELPQLQRTVDFHDGCRVQFDCGAYMCWVADAKALCGVAIEDVKNRPNHGKCGADSAGKKVPAELREIAKRVQRHEQDAFPPGDRSVVLALALESRKKGNALAAAKQQLREAEAEEQAARAAQGSAEAKVAAGAPDPAGERCRAASIMLQRARKNLRKAEAAILGEDKIGMWTIDRYFYG